MENSNKYAHKTCFFKWYRDIRSFYVKSENEEIRLGNKTDDIDKSLINSFLNNYQKEELVLRNGSNFVFESVELMSYRIHKTNMKRRSSYVESPNGYQLKKLQ